MKMSEKITIRVKANGFNCSVQVHKNDRVESIITWAVTAYNKNLPEAEIPRFNYVYSVSKARQIGLNEIIAVSCDDRDSLILSYQIRGETSPIPNFGNDRQKKDFIVCFHAQPIGFTITVSEEKFVVSKIYPSSSAATYHRLHIGVQITKVNNKSTSKFNLQQLKDLLSGDAFPMYVHFRSTKSTKMILQDQTHCRSENGETFRTKSSKHREDTENVGSIANTENSLPLSTYSRRAPSGKISCKEKKLPSFKQNESKNFFGNKDSHKMEIKIIEMINQLRDQLNKKQNEAKEIISMIELQELKLLKIKGCSESMIKFKNPNRISTNDRRHSISAFDFKNDRMGMNSTGFSKSGEIDMEFHATPKRTLSPNKSKIHHQLSSICGDINPLTMSMDSKYRNSIKVAIRNGKEIMRSKDNARTMTSYGGRDSYIPRTEPSPGVGAYDLRASFSSFTSKGGLISKNPAPRNSYILSTESPGVGYYEIHQRNHVKGGEIGDSERELKWM